MAHPENSAPSDLSLFARAAEGFSLAIDRARLRRMLKNRADPAYQADLWMAVAQASQRKAIGGQPDHRALLSLCLQGFADASFPSEMIASIPADGTLLSPKEAKILQVYDREAILSASDFAAYARLKLPPEEAEPILSACAEGDALLESLKLRCRQEPADSPAERAPGTRP